MSCGNDDFKSLIIPNERHKANARERVRTYSVNTAFTTLRNLIPTDPVDRKLSKIETLRLACSYISHLGSILLTGSCEVQTREEVLTNDLNFAQKSSICTFCVTSAKFETNRYQ